MNPVRVSAASFMIAPPSNLANHENRTENYWKSTENHEIHAVKNCNTPLYFFHCMVFMVFGVLPMVFEMVFAVFEEELCGRWNVPIGNGALRRLSVSQRSGGAQLLDLFSPDT